MKEIVDQLSPPGREKNNRRRLFRIIERLGDLMAQDGEQVLRNFFPLLASDKALAAHGKALAIPRYSHDSDETYRQRVAAASFYLQTRGEAGFFKSEIARRFDGREVSLTEEFLHLTIQVLDMTEKDRAWLWEFLGNELDPNIAINLIDWFRFLDRMDPSDMADIAVLIPMVDILDNGFCHDGRSLRDHGEQVLHKGMIRHDGTQRRTGSRRRIGTWSGLSWRLAGRDGTRLHNGSLRHVGLIAASVDRPSMPAFHSNDKADVLVYQMSHAQSDKMAVRPVHVGGIRHDGKLMHGGPTLPFVDDFVLRIKRV